MRTFVFTILFILGFGIQHTLSATYTVDNLPMVYTQDKTRHVINPDHILSVETVSRMDSMLHRLELQKGIQSIIAVVERIQGGDCYEFALNLGNKYGVGNQQNTGLIILLSTQDRCYQILTGEGLEGTLPDAICRRIENRRMVPYLKIGDWDAAMLNTVSAVYGVVQGDESLLSPVTSTRNNDNSYTFAFIFLAVFLGFMILSWYINRKNNACPQCGNFPMQRQNSTVTVDRIRLVEHHQTTYRCPKCGKTVHRSHDEPWDNGSGFGGFLL